jgi:hypothetical protein
MALAWFVCPYKRLTRLVAGVPTPVVPPTRYCAMDEFTAAIAADGGTWDETEILGDHALVKVRADPTTLVTINAAPGFLRIPGHFDLSDTLGDLTAGQRNAILAKLEALGYSNAEVVAALPANWQAVTLGQVLRFAASRRLKPRYDVATDTIVVDGPEQPVKPVELCSIAVQ